MTDIDCDVPTAVVTAAAWHTRTGAFCPRSAFPGASVPGAGTGIVSGAGPVSMVRPVPHVRTKAVAVSLAGAAAMALDGQPTNYIQMTSVFVSGEGASGSPPDWEPA